ncbi:MAG: PD40 domain-containing protein [Gemmatimonadaceae bacterium]|nr:PD40 domain-containing protein [Gemmatimonadaceae bacterium]
MRWSLLLLVGACHAQISDGGIDGGGSNVETDATDSGSPVDAAGVTLGPWSPPIMFGGAATATAEDDATLAWTENELVFAKNDGATKHLYTMSRADAASPFGLPTLVPFSAAADRQEQSPRFSSDNLTLYFASNRGGNDDIWMVTRPSVGGAWGTPTRILNTATAATEKWYVPCDGDRYLMIRNIDGQGDIFEGVGTGTPTRVAELSSPVGETGTFVTQDCLEVYFASVRDTTNDLWKSSRSSIAAPWSAPVKVTDFNTATNNEQDPWMSADGRTFIFASDADGTDDSDIYISTRSPI